MSEALQIERVSFGDLLWAKAPWSSLFVPCCVADGGLKKIHGKIPRDRKVIQWLGGDAVSSFEELLEDGWEFRPLPRPTE